MLKVQPCVVTSSSVKNDANGQTLEVQLAVSNTTTTSPAPTPMSFYSIQIVNPSAQDLTDYAYGKSITLTAAPTPASP